MQDFKQLKEKALQETQDICKKLNISDREIKELIDVITNILHENDYERAIINIPNKPKDITRCKDCKWAKLREGYSDRLVCRRWNNTTGKDEFCSYGYQ